MNLNKKQQSAFNRLKKAYKDCEKLKIEFVQVLNSLDAYNGEYVESYGDKTSDFDEDRTINADELFPADSLKITDAWADDCVSHRILLTEKGLKEFNSY